jgi:hypothetical protein
MFEKSENINELAAALAKAQAVLQPAEKDRANPFFKSKYATLESVATTCRAALADNGLAVVQTPEVGDHGSALRTTLVHSSGQWISGVMRLHGEEKNMQAMGSAISYARRYGLAAIVGVVTDEDDDGNAAAGNDAARTQPQRQPVQTKRQPPPAQDAQADRDAEFIYAIDAAYASRGFAPVAAAYAQRKVLADRKINSALSMDEPKRHAYIKAIRDGQFDDLKAEHPLSEPPSEPPAPPAPAQRPNRRAATTKAA